eukprot:TRINITY_DN4354_c0_g1_i1.p1 TRINITY_DN4354_c0_g1~~TRINITY_DN4354_c0_g1_i1.p1  ORF type:complete len:350 (+),score=166.02 TRINITY_DN4354_c0_g1_i1:73-1122(+)
MVNYLFIIILFLFQLNSFNCSNCEADYSRNPYYNFYLTTESVTQVDISGVVPQVITPPGVASYLLPTSCLGYLGPLGPYGPLGSLGPIGNNSWNLSYWISGWGDWSEFSEQISGMGGPLSAEGPLGENGPLSPYWYNEICPCINDFSHQTMNGGLWVPLGPVAVLGAAGALGPLGPIGAHGFGTDLNGQYYRNDQIQRTYDAPYTQSVNRTFELFEKYSQNFANSMQDNDVSFLVEAIWAGNDNSENDSYIINVKQKQFLTILLVPTYQLDNFNLILYASDKKTVIAKSESSIFIDWIHIRVPANTRLFIQVVLSVSYQSFDKSYRLYVSGSTPYFQQTDILGPHQIKI